MAWGPGSEYELLTVTQMNPDSQHCWFLIITIQIIFYPKMGVYLYIPVSERLEGRKLVCQLHFTSDSHCMR